MSDTSNLPVYSALLGALIGSGVPILGKIYTELRERCRLKKAVASQIYAEITALLEIVSNRKYFEDFESQLNNIAKTNNKFFCQILVDDDVMIIYKSNIANLHLLEMDLQVKVVKFYRYLMALIQDVKPGGIFNNPEFGVTEISGNQFLSIANQMLDLGKELQVELERIS